MLLRFSCLLAILAFAGCFGGDDSVISEKDEKQYQRGYRLQRDGRHQEALLAYLKVIDKRRDAPESHLEVGRLYLNAVNDPLAAIYHFRKYLEAKPNVEQSPMVRQMVETAKKKFAQSLPGKSYSADDDRLEAIDTIKQLRQENAMLRNRLAMRERDARNIAQSGEAVSFAPVVSRPRVVAAPIYTVEAGDTLSRVSQKVYGSSIHWKKIYAANGDKLKTPHSLRVGQVLKIPKLED